MRLAGILLAGLACGLNLVGLFDHDLWMPDEPREAEIAREYSVRESWTTPWLNSGRWLEKPPLYHWAAAALFRATGTASPGVARLPSALSGIGIGLLAWLLASRLGPKGIGPWAAFLAWTSAQLLSVSHGAMVDALFSLCVTGAVTALAFEEGVLAALCMGLSFLAKFHLGPMMAGATAVGWGFLSGNWKPVKALLKPLPVLVFLAVALPWPWRLYQAQGAFGAEALRETLWGQLFARSTGGSFGHAQPPWYYLPQVLIFAAPASLLLPWAGVWAWKKRKEDRLASLCLAWLLGSLVLLSIPRAKRAVYLAPCVVPAAVLAALWGREFLERRQEWKKWALGGAICLPVLLSTAGGVLIPRMDARLSFQPLAWQVKRLSTAGFPRTIEGYSLSENVQGAVCFALGQRVRCFTEPAHLAERLKMGRRLVVMPASAWRDLVFDRRVAGRMRLVGGAEADGERYSIVESVP